MATIAVLGTMDSKGEEHGFVAEQIRRRGHKVLVIDSGTLEAPRLKPDITRREVAAAAGVDLATIVAKRDRGEAVAAMSKGAPALLSRLVRRRRYRDQHGCHEGLAYRFSEADGHDAGQRQHRSVRRR